MKIENVTVGPHTLLIHCPGYADRSLKIDVKSRETVQQAFRLRRIFTPDTLVDTTRGIVKGVLVNKDPLGNIIIETAPGVQQTIPAGDIRKVSPIEK